MNFLNKVDKVLTEKNSFLSLKSLLVEEDENPSFDMPDEDGEGSETPDEGSETPDESSETSNEDITEDPVDKSEQETQDIGYSIAAVETLTKKINKLEKEQKKHINGEEINKIEDYIESQLDENFKIGKNSLKNYFIFEESEKDLEDSVENLESSIKSLDNVVSQGTSLVKKISEKEADVKEYVKAAIKAYKNFDKLFAKELIVKQAAKNVLVLNSGDNIEKNVQEFDDLYHKELYSKFGIEYPEHVLDNTKHNTATGAVKQG
jgi:hypothetical protein